MNNNGRIQTLCFGLACISACVAGCSHLKDDGLGNEGEKGSYTQESRLSDAEDADGVDGIRPDTEMRLQNGSQVQFPEHCYLQAGQATIDCKINLPVTFQPDAFYQTEVKGYLYADPDAAMKEFAEGKEISETHTSVNAAGNTYMSYVFTDGSGLSGIGDFLVYDSERYGWYQSIGSYLARENSSGELHFADSAACAQIVMDMAERLHMPADAFQLSWYSLDQSALQELQEKAVEGSLGITMKEQSYRQDISGEDEIYFFYSWQYQQGLPVMPEMMQYQKNFLLNDRRTLAAYQMQASVSASGLESIYFDQIYQFEDTEEQFQFLPFDKVAETVLEKYAELLPEESTYTFTEASLFQRVWRDEDGNFYAQPAWRFIGKGSDGSELTELVDAGTGKEIILPG